MEWFRSIASRIASPDNDCYRILELVHQQHERWNKWAMSCVAIGNSLYGTYCSTLVTRAVVEQLHRLWTMDFKDCMLLVCSNTATLVQLFTVNVANAHFQT